MPSTTPRQKWTDAVWESNLTPTQRLVAHAFARYASRGLDDVWLAQSHLCEITGLTKPTAAKTTRALVDLGWLVRTEPARQRRSARYGLTFPSGQMTSPLEPVQGESQLAANDQTRGKVEAVRGKADSAQGESDLPRTSIGNPDRKPQLLPTDLIAAFRDAGVEDEATMREIVEKADEDAGTKASGVGRLRSQPGYLKRLIKAGLYCAGTNEDFATEICATCWKDQHICDAENSGLVERGESACIGYRDRHGINANDERKTG